MLLAAALAISTVAPSAPADDGPAVAQAAKKKCKKGKKGAAAAKKCKKGKKKGQGAASLSISPTSADFGTVIIGGTSFPKYFTVTNSGPSTTGSLSFTVAGPDASRFTIDPGVCGQKGKLTASSSCELGVTYKPSALTTQTATLNATASPGGAASASLSGMGEPL